MKKLIVGFVAMTIAMSVLNVMNIMALHELTKPAIVEENGYQVVEDNDPTTSTILATVTSDDADGDGYVIVTNQYDSKDTVAIDKADLKLGDKVAVTFFHDDVVKVSKQ